MIVTKVFNKTENLNSMKDDYEKGQSDSNIRVLGLTGQQI